MCTRRPVYWTREKGEPTSGSAEPPCILWPSLTSSLKTASFELFPKASRKVLKPQECTRTFGANLRRVTLSHCVMGTGSPRSATVSRARGAGGVERCLQKVYTGGHTRGTTGPTVCSHAGTTLFYTRSKAVSTLFYTRSKAASRLFPH